MESILPLRGVKDHEVHRPYATQDSALKFYKGQ